jgi:hypothetical protein
MINITLWDKVRNGLGLGYSKTTQEEIAFLEIEKAALLKHAKADALLAAAEAEQKAAKAAADKKAAVAAAAKKAAEVKTAPVKKVASAGKGKTASSGTKKLHEATRDGDGDGYINDGQANERKVSAKKPAAKKAAPKASTTKATPKPKK